MMSIAAIGSDSAKLKFIHFFIPSNQFTQPRDYKVFVDDYDL
jgi:hypothetical protein